MNIEAVDAVAYSPEWTPRRGWHDDHRANDRTPVYLPALMQVRSEFAAFVDVLRDHGLLGGRCLQLGLGECDASHAAWGRLFKRVVTIDYRVTLDSFEGKHWMFAGRDTHDRTALDFAALRGPYDMLFVDAGHKLADVQQDDATFSPLVRPGGIVAFHDACKRPGYEAEVDVWQHVSQMALIGDEVGIAWMQVNREK